MPTISDAQALNILRESNNKTYDAQSKAHTAALGGVVTAKQAIAKTTADSAKGDQYSALTKAGVQGMGTLLNSKLNMKANMGLTEKARAGMSPDAAAAHHAKMAGLNAATSGGSVGQAITQAGDAVDQNMGFAKMSSDAKIDGKNAEVQETIANQGAEVAKGNKEKATKGFDSVEDFAKGMIDRAKAVFDKMF